MTNSVRTEIVFLNNDNLFFLQAHSRARSSAREAGISVSPGFHIGHRPCSRRPLAEHGLHPILVLKIPTQGLANATFERVGRRPTQGTLKFRGINRISPVVPG